VAWRGLALKDPPRDQGELILAIDELRLHPPGQPWLIPVRFDDCKIPEREMRGNRCRQPEARRPQMSGDTAIGASIKHACQQVADAIAAPFLSAVRRVLAKVRS
jgi:hypothetical protein